MIETDRQTTNNASDGIWYERRENENQIFRWSFDFVHLLITPKIIDFFFSHESMKIEFDRLSPTKSDVMT